MLWGKNESTRVPGKPLNLQAFPPAFAGAVSFIPSRIVIKAWHRATPFGSIEWVKEAIVQKNPSLNLDNHSIKLWFQSSFFHLLLGKVKPLAPWEPGNVLSVSHYHVITIKLDLKKGSVKSGCGMYKHDVSNIKPAVRNTPNSLVDMHLLSF